MSEYQQGFVMGERAVREFGVEHALDTSIKMREALHRFNMYGIGYRTAVGLAMEKVWA